MSETIEVAPADVMRLGPVVEKAFGITVRAVQGKIYRGDWLEGREFARAPDGSIWLIRDGVRAWVMGERR